MKGFFQWLVAVPSFPADDEESRRARLFNQCYWFANLWIALVLVVKIFGGRESHSLVAWILVVLATGALPYIAARRGRLDVGVKGWLAHSFVCITTSIALLGTIRAPILGFYLILVFCSGQLFGMRAMVATIALSSLSVAGLIVAENMGWLPVPDYRVSISQWVTATAFLACAGGLTFAMTKQLRASLRRAEAEVADRRRKEKELMEINRKLEEALASVRTLKGLLPVCGWCRKVREDEGYWSELESYIATHTDTTFTHGICPHCQEKHFPASQKVVVPEMEKNARGAAPIVIDVTVHEVREVNSASSGPQ